MSTILPKKVDSLENIPGDSIYYKTKVITYLGIITLGYLIIAFTIFLIFQTKFYKRNGYNSDCHKGIYGLVIIIFLNLYVSFQT